MKFWLFILYSTSILYASAQIKTLIPAEEEVNLPSNNHNKIGLSTTFDETIIHKEKKVTHFVKHIQQAMPSEHYFLLDSGKDFIELFIVQPCRSFNLKDIQSHQIIDEGIITSSMFIQFYDSIYTIDLTDYKWIDKQKKTSSIDKIYSIYQRNDDLRYKIKYYGILKSCEYGIAESLSNIMAVIEEVMKGKGKKS